MRALWIAPLLLAAFVMACGPKRPPRIDAPPPEYEAPEGYDDGDAGENDDAETGN